MALVVLRVSCPVEHPGFRRNATSRRGKTEVLKRFDGDASVFQQGESFRAFGRQRHESHG